MTPLQRHPPLAPTFSTHTYHKHARGQCQSLEKKRKSFCLVPWYLEPVSGGERLRGRPDLSTSPSSHLTNPHPTTELASRSAYMRWSCDLPSPPPVREGGERTSRQRTMSTGGNAGRDIARGGLSRTGAYIQIPAQHQLAHTGNPQHRGGCTDTLYNSIAAGDRQTVDNKCIRSSTHPKCAMRRLHSTENRSLFYPVNLSRRSSTKRSTRAQKGKRSSGPTSAEFQGSGSWKKAYAIGEASFEEQTLC